jgi:hypothetical protein
MGFIKGVIVTLVILALVVLLGLGYLGFIPGVSSIFGADKPRDLGVSFTPADLASARAKTGRQVTELAPNLPPAESLKFTGSKDENVSLTQAEFNAYINDKWEYYPVTDIQVKISPDGVAEASGILHIDRFHGLAEALQVPQDVRNQVKDYVAAIPGNPAFYVKGKAEVVNGQITTLDFPEVQIGKLSLPQGDIPGFKQNAIFGELTLPQSAFSALKQSAIDAIYWFFKRVDGFSVKSFNFNGGKVNFNGTLPATKSFSPAR